jgi:uncharacterized protein YndB with AHSA1/START domain
MAKDLFVEKSILINRPRKEVFEYLKYSKNQDEFSVWNMKDPNRKVEEKGTDGTVGHIYSWDSATDKNVGAGSQEIKNLVGEEQIEYEVRFERPMKNTAAAKFVLGEVTKNQTKVTWDFSGPTKFPMSLFKSIFEKMLGKDLSKSLDNLKARLES